MKQKGGNWGKSPQNKSSLSTVHSLHFSRRVLLIDWGGGGGAWGRGEGQGSGISIQNLNEEVLL